MSARPVGPWSIQRISGNTFIIGSHGQTLCDVEPGAMPEDVRAAVAAPDLLEALRDLEQLVTAHIGEEADNWCRVARAAIRKVTGEPA